MTDNEVIETSSQSEKDILKACINLMGMIHSDMLEYMEYMGFEWDKDNEEEIPRLSYSYFEIVQRLFLWNTSHGGGTSTRAKCAELGVDDCEEVVFEPEMEEEDE